MPKKQPIIFGEALFDIFEDKSVAGGAPFNVAWHLQGLGARPCFLTRLGEDAEGDHLCDLAARWGFPPTGLQRDEVKETGRVLVKLDKGSASYDIKADQAYDYVDFTQAWHTVEKTQPGLLYHGSLGLRQDVSRNTLRQLREQVAVPVFFDVNLREPWVDRAVLEDGMQHANWVKCNDEELATLGQCMQMQGDEDTLAQALVAHYKLDGLLLTRGADGVACYLEDASKHACRPPEGIQIVDTVGAGDSFSAVFIFGLLEGWDVDISLRRASLLASKVCQMRGATSEDAGLYQSLKETW